MSEGVHMCGAHGVDDAAVAHVAAVGEHVDDVAHLPLVVGGLLEKLDPHVRRRHRQAVMCVFVCACVHYWCGV